MSTHSPSKPARKLAALLLSVAMLGLPIGSAQAQETQEPELVHAWTKLDWTFPNAAARRAYEADRVYEKATLAGLAVDRAGAFYVTSPRWLDGRIPASLNKVVVRNGRSLLQPFPSAAMNDAGNPAAFQNVLGVKIDARNRLWALDMGWVAGREATPLGAQKLVVIDLNTGRELRRYLIPDTVANRSTSFLNDIAIDERNDVAYLSDSGNRSGSPVAAGLIVYDYRTNTSRRVIDRHASIQDDVSRPLVVNGEAVFPGNPLSVGINGLALTPDGSRLFWSITTGDAIYSAPTSVLLNRRRSAAEVVAAISAPVRIGGGSDGLAADSLGRIWITNLTLNRVQLLDPKTNALTTVSQSPLHVWPDSFAWGDKGQPFFTSNHLNHAFGGVMKFDGAPNYRIWRLQTGSQRASTLASAK
jgi:sugar lactone lactonase YvrE